MLNSRCLYLNQYHKEVLSTLPWKGVNLVWVNFATFIFNCCTLIDNPTSCIAKTQKTTTWFPFAINTLTSFVFLDLFFRYKWSDTKVNGMFQCLLAFFNEVVFFSTTSMASSNAWLLHLPLMLIGFDLLILHCFVVGSCDLEDGGTFPLFWLG